MKDDIVNVLTYMFDCLFEKNKEHLSNEIDDEAIKDFLADAGFKPEGIEKAINWLEDIIVLKNEKITSLISSKNSIRIYNDAEKLILDTKARNFLLFMENTKQISSHQREIIIEQVMLLNNYTISLDDLKYITMAVISDSSDNSATKELTSINEKNTKQ
jgi:Smg protein